MFISLAGINDIIVKNQIPKHTICKYEYRYAYVTNNYNNKHLVGETGMNDAKHFYKMLQLLDSGIINCLARAEHTLARTEISEKWSWSLHLSSVC